MARYTAKNHEDLIWDAEMEMRMTTVTIRGDGQLNARCICMT